MDGYILLPPAEYDIRINPEFLCGTDHRVFIVGRPGVDCKIWFDVVLDGRVGFYWHKDWAARKGGVGIKVGPETRVYVKEVTRVES